MAITQIMKGDESMADEKNRHGCLTALLILMIIANSATALMYLFGRGMIRHSLPSLPDYVFPILIVMALFNLVCAIALFKWKKWGFWGFCASTVVALAVNLSAGLGIGRSLTGIIGVLVLYGVLHIGKGNKGWPQLD